MEAKAAIDIAEKFVAARRSGTALADYPGTIPQAIDSAYAIQDAAITSFDDVVAGWKVGRIWPPLSEQLETNRLFGPVFASSVQHANGIDTLAGQIFADGFGAAEAEFLLKIGAGVDPLKTSYSLEEATAFIDAVHVGIEIASSPFVGINENGPLATISDFGNNNGIIIGDEIIDWQESDFADWHVSLFIDGVEAGTGKASAFPDGPIGSVRFLLENLAARGIAVAPGTWVSSGAVTGVHQVTPGQKIRASFSEAYQVNCTIEAVPIL